MRRMPAQSRAWAAERSFVTGEGDADGESGEGMCGIAGKIDFAGRVNPEDIHRMCSAIEHRGPDLARRLV